MSYRMWIVSIAIIIGLSSCNMQAPQTTATPASESTPLLDPPTSSSPTSTPVPAETQTLAEIALPTLTPTSTPNVFLAAPKDQPVNCRFGPATSYAVIGFLELGMQAEIIGRNPDSTWWYVRNPSDPSTSCWLSADFIEATGNVEALPVVNPPVIMVTGVDVQVDPPVINVACNSLPQSVIITARITANGPTTVVWHWEANAGVISEEKSLLFEVSDTKTVQEYYQVNKVGDYMIQVQTTLPNIMTGQAVFKVVCTP